MKLLQNRIKPAEFVRTVWGAQPEPGTTLEEMLLPEYWAHVAKTIKPGDRIDVTAADGSWFAELFVRGVTPNAVCVAVLREVRFNDSDAPATGGVTVKHRGGAGWSVVRDKDKVVLFEGGATKEDANKWVAEQSLI